MPPTAEEDVDDLLPASIRLMGRISHMLQVSLAKRAQVLQQVQSQYEEAMHWNDEANQKELVRVDAERGLLLVKGGIPGAPGSDVIVRPAVKARKSA